MDRFFYTSEFENTIDELLNLVGLKREDVFDPQMVSPLRTTTSDNEKEYEVLVEAPGATQDMLDVQFKDDVVTVKIDYGKDGKIRTGKYAWAKKFKDVDGGAINAKLDGGILVIALPKKPESQPQKIKIN